MTTNLKACLRAMVLPALLLSAPSAFASTIQVTTNIFGNQTWYGTNEYVLNKMIYIVSDASLTIEPGTVVKGKPGGTNDATALLVARGGKIYAEGTPTKPIIMTAEADDVTDNGDLGIYARGLWGGLVLFGHATLNQAADVAGNAASPIYEVYEGLADITDPVTGEYLNRFGGNNDNDNSGVIRYVSIRHGGVKLLPNKEINGLSMGGVGRGTTIDHVEAYAIADDGFEFFGGTVNTKYLVSAFCDDDGFDADMGYNGKNQFWLAIQERGAKDNGAEFNGEINGATTGTKTPIANYEVYNCTWIGAGTNTTGNRGLQLRDYAAPKIYNSIITEYAGFGVRIDAAAGLQLTNDLLQVRDNLWWNFATNGVALPTVSETAQASLLFSTASWNNAAANPLLISISRTNFPAFKLDPRPKTGSPALTSGRTAPDNGFYTPVAYKGAFDNNNLWIDGWTALSAYDFVPRRDQNVVQVTTNVFGNQTWYRSNEYVLNKMIYVVSNATLTIEAGTVVKGKPGGTNDATALFIARGGKIFAIGSPEQPIIMTAEADDIFDNGDLGIYARGLWGGLVVFGNATLNQAADVTGNAATPKYEVYEGLADITDPVTGERLNRFGGNNDDDNSGVIRYVSIRHGGVKLLPNKEINGLSLGGVGRGTTVDHVEAYAIADDGFEFFGGTVNTKYLVSAFCDDDGFDADMGYLGKNQFWLAIQERGAKDNGAEFNGEINGATTGTNLPIANYEVYNCTWIGAGTNTTGNRGLQLRDYAAPKIYNSIITEFGGFGVRIDAAAGLQLTNDLLQVRDNLWWNFATNGVAMPTVNETAQAAVLFSTASWSNEVSNPLLTGISRTNFPTFGLNPLPAEGSPAKTSNRTAPNNGFYNQVAWKGAMNSKNWAVDWTALGEYSLFSGSGGGEQFTPAPFGVSGSVELQAFSGASRLVRFIASEVSGGTTNYLKTIDVVLTFTGTTASYGSIPVPPNTTHLSAKTAWNLRKRLPVSFVNGVATVNFTGANLLKGGDCATLGGGTGIDDSDNDVNADDYLLLKNRYSIICASADDRRADIDGDDAITSDDYLMLQNNYTEQGDAP